MPLQIGDDSSQGWSRVKDLRVDGKAVQLVAMAVESSWLELWRRDPYGMSIISNQTLIIPTWALYADVILIGGGGGGAGGSGAVSNSGRGGKAGNWRGISHPVQPGQGMVFTIGAGGAGGNTESGTGGTGGTTSVVLEDYSLSANGGAGGVGTSTSANAKGEDALFYEQGTWQVTGGDGGTQGNAGQAPGGGGGGGAGGIFGRWSPGKPGGRGGAWVRFRSA